MRTSVPQDNGMPAQDWRSVAERTEEATPLGVERARAAEPGRGRDASAPQDIPARGWRDIVWRLLWSISEDRVLSTAGSVAFFALLAVFPGLATVVSLYGLFADAGSVGGWLALLDGVVPDGVLELVGDELARVASQRSGALGLAFLLGLAVALWSANSGMSALFDALNVVYKEREKRSLALFYAMTFLFTLGTVCFVLADVGAVVVLPVALKLFGVATSAERVLAVARWPLLLLVVVLGLALIYRFGPSRRPAKWRWVTWGSTFAAVLWVGVSMLYSWYVASFDSYNRIYGSLGAGVGLMTWIWLSVVVVLAGAELDAEMERQTAVDTTSGRPKPLGARGAVVADTVGDAAS
jgi:membrane protein